MTRAKQRRSESRTISYFSGSTWARETARKALPVLVRFAEARRRTTYTELAEILFNDKKYAFPLKDGLGRLRRSLDALAGAEPRKFGKIPHIQLIVCNQRTGRPGNLSLGSLGVRKSVADSMEKRELNLLVGRACQEVFDYPRWHEVLRALGISPTSINLPPPERLLPKIREIEGRSGEGAEHKRLKLFLAENPRKVGIRWRGRGDVEVLVLSGDKLDVSFRNKKEWIALEVKGKNSPELDLIRGIFQCVKYRATMAAQLRYEAATIGSHVELGGAKAMLACGCTVPRELREFAASLDVEIKSGLVVPTGFVPQKEAA